MGKKSKTQLTMKQEKFCQEYVNTGFASAAYRLAYSTENMKPESIWCEACKLLASPNVSQRVEQLKRENAERAAVDRARVEGVLMSIVDSDIADFFKYDEKKGKFVMKGIHELPQHARLAVKKIKTKHGESEYELNGKVDAARLLASMNGWEQPKEVKLSGGGVPVRSEIRIGFDDEEDE